MRRSVATGRLIRHPFRYAGHLTAVLPKDPCQQSATYNWVI